MCPKLKLILFFIIHAHKIKIFMSPHRPSHARSDVQVMVTDWDMPGDIDGVKLAHLVRQRWPSVGVIVTADKRHTNPWDLPADVQFLAKPYQPSALIELVKAMVLGSDEVVPGAPVHPEGIMMHSPVRAEVGGMGIPAAQRKPNKT